MQIDFLGSAFQHLASPAEETARALVNEWEASLVTLLFHQALLFIPADNPYGSPPKLTTSAPALRLPAQGSSPSLQR